jgi:hypothetical protein
MCGQLHTPTIACQAKEHLVVIELEVGWATEPVWTLRGTEKLLALPTNSDINKPK